MITLTRRACLKLFSVAGLSTALPSLVGASTETGASEATVLKKWPKSTTPAYATNIEITLQRVVARTPAEDYAYVTIRNTGEKPSTLRYIYPGVVEADGNSYDLNALLSNGSLTLEPNKNVYLRLKQMQRAADRQNPPVQIAQSGQVVIKNYLVSSRSEQPPEMVRSAFA